MGELSVTKEIILGAVKHGTRARLEKGFGDLGYD
jgi:hypothetical protein